MRQHLLTQLCYLVNLEKNLRKTNWEHIVDMQTRQSSCNSYQINLCLYLRRLGIDAKTIVTKLYKTDNQMYQHECGESTQLTQFVTYVPGSGPVTSVRWTETRPGPGPASHQLQQTSGHHTTVVTRRYNPVSCSHHPPSHPIKQKPLMPT